MSSSMRIGGLASGMDIDQIVSDLMKAQRTKMSSLEQERQEWEWKQDDYRNINSVFRSFRDDFLFDMKLSSTYQAKQATSSNEGIVTATAGSNAVEGTHRVTVEQLASGASITSGDVLGSSNDLTTINSQFGTSDGMLDFKVNDVVFKMDASKDSIHELVRRINSHSAAGVSLNTTQEATDTQAQEQKLQLVDSALTEGLTITIGDQTIALWDSSKTTYQTESIAKESLDADYLYDISDANYDTANEIIADIASNVSLTNATLASNANELTISSSELGKENAISAEISGGKQWNVNATYDETVDRFFLSTNKTGNDQHLKVMDNTLSQRLNITNGSDIDTSLLNGTEYAIASDGTNAKVTIDDLTITEYSNNQFTLNGVSYNLNNAEPSQTVNVTVQSDTEAVFESVKSFVEEYNKVIETIESAINEDRNSDYKWPLSDLQKEQLTDDQIDRWRNKARSGMLHNDYTLRGVRDKLRNSMMALSKIGITTTKDYFSSKLEIDEDKLRDVISDNPDRVKELFTKDSFEYSGQGIAKRVSDDISYAINTIINKAGLNGGEVDDDSFIGKRIGNLDDDIDDWKDRLTQIEDRYWSQFTAMEKAINQMNQQSAWLSQQFGG